MWLSACVFVLACACYINSLTGEFVYDDIAAITSNRVITETQSWTALWRMDYWGVDIVSNESCKSYRPLTSLSFKLNYAVGEADPVGFHLVNVLLHAIVSVLVTHLTARLCRNSTPNSHSFGCCPRLLSGVLFASHPVHVEAVSSIVGRAELLCGLFVLSSILVGGSKQGEDPSHSTDVRLIVSISLAVLAFLCKETGLITLPLLAMVDLLLAAKTPRLRYHAGRRCALLFLLTFLQLSWRTIIVQRSQLAPVFYKEAAEAVRNNPASFQADSVHRWLSFSLYHARHAWLVLCPAHLSADYSYDALPLVESLSDVRLLGALSLYLSCGALLFFAASRITSHPVVSLGSAFLFVPYVPASNALFAVGFVVAERVLYLPSIGFCMLISYAVSVLNANPAMNPVWRKSLAVLVLVPLALYCSKTWSRNTEWHSAETLWQSAVQVTPGSAKVWMNLGVAIRDRPPLNSDGNREAMLCFLKAAEIDANFEKAWYNAGVEAFKLKLVQQAKRYYRRSIAVNDRSAEAYGNLAVILHQQAELESEPEHLKEAIQLYHKAIEIKPYRSHYYSNLATAYLKTQDPAHVQTAKALFEKARLLAAT
eukprot:GILJ01019668.1.p1 GENE.GILJ01019668.1~~GILJ01019668.1.p1  ORF type:complete len:595 (-),score=72.55 GILJ01019668.1:203-1987(-)